jgi:hypothetical protein
LISKQQTLQQETKRRTWVDDEVNKFRFVILGTFPPSTFSSSPKRRLRRHPDWGGRGYAYRDCHNYS